MKATFAAGCFWGVEHAFRQVKGVRDTAVGFMGGQVAHPSYEQVCTGTTGHAEVVQLNYDPDQVAYEALLEVFWGCHDPTQRDRQGPDVGPQYRSVIFYHTEAQRRAALASKAALVRAGKAVVTEIAPATAFYRAEAYHQRYFEKHGLSGCRVR